jgi:hypothetical protein
MPIDAHGPIDFVLIEFSGGASLAQTAAELERLVELGTISLYDLVVVHAGTDGSVTLLELTDQQDPGLAALAAFAGARSGLVDLDDAREAAAAMRPGSVAVLIVYENTWAAPFVSAARAAGGQMIASERIPAERIEQALDALDAADA